jgi:hypothetical protein
MNMKIRNKLHILNLAKNKIFYEPITFASIIQIFRYEAIPKNEFSRRRRLPAGRQACPPLEGILLRRKNYNLKPKT